MKVKGIIYDLDGTIIDSASLHEQGWRAAGKKFNIAITPKMYLDQKGRTNEDAVKMMLPKNKITLSAEFIKVKEKFVINNIGDVSFLPGFIEAFSALKKKKLQLWICTSSKKFFIQAVLKKVPALKSFENKIVYRELYKQGKPSSEPLLLTSKKMNLSPKECYYIGDAEADYHAALNAGMNFIFFNSCNTKNCPSPLSIKDHQEIIKFLM